MTHVLNDADVTVTYARTIPTRPYGNDKVEISVSAVCPDGDDVFEFADFIRRQLVVLVDKAEIEAGLET